MEIGIDSFAAAPFDLETGKVMNSAEAISQLLDRIEHADKMGLDVFGIGEHHRREFLDSAPSVILAAAAARTKNIRLTSAVTVLSAADPVRVFQNFATLDLVSNGRAESVIGRGSFSESFPLFGFHFQDYDQIFEEKLGLLLKIMDNEFVNMKVAKKILGLSISTLRNYEKEGKIECIKTENGWRKFNVKKYLLDNKIKVKDEIKKNYIYCRVSSYDRKEDLQRQVDYLKNKYPTYEVITDIGSGINFKRKGLKKLIKIAIANELNEVVVTYKDRLCRIGYDLIEFIFKDYSNAKIKIENIKEKNINEEITEDLIEIITVYSSKLHGRRSNKIEEI